MSKYNFDENIRKLSENTNQEDVRLEWKFYKQTKNEKGRCICNHTLRACINYYVNILNGNMIQLGSSCMNKFKDIYNVDEELNDECEIEKKRYVGFVLKFIKSDNEYKNIADVLEYEKDIRENIENKINDDIIKSNTIDKLDMVLEDVMYLMDLIRRENKLMIFLESKINEINKKKTMIMEDERKRKEELERRIEAERIARIEMERKRKDELERQQEEERKARIEMKKKRKEELREMELNAMISEKENERKNIEEILKRRELLYTHYMNIGKFQTNEDKENYTKDTMYYIRRLEELSK